MSDSTIDDFLDGVEERLGLNEGAGEIADLSDEELEALCPDPDEEVIPGRPWKSLTRKELDDLARGRDPETVL